MQILTFIPQKTDVLVRQRISLITGPQLRIVRREHNLQFLRTSQKVGAAEGLAYAALGACALSGIVAAFARAAL